MFSRGRSDFDKAVLRGWSSHPQSLVRQRKWAFTAALSPILVVLVFAVLAFSGYDAWDGFFAHPARWVVIFCAAVAISLGALMTMTLMNLLGRAKVGRQFSGGDRDLVGVGTMLMLAFFWIVPLALSFAQRIWGGRLAPGPVLFLLNLMCFVPMLGLLVWARWAEAKVADKSRPRLIWFWIGTLILAVVAFTLLGDVHALLMRTQFAPYLGRVKPMTLRLVSLAALVPLSMICYLAGFLFRLPDVKNKPVTPDKNGKPVFLRRVANWVKGLFAKTQQRTVDSTDVTYPEWVDELAKTIPDYVIWETAEVGKPDRLTTPDYSEQDKSEGAKSLWMLMGDDPEMPPTKAQSKFFLRYKAAYVDAQAAAAKGNLTSADLVLSGDGGSGRTEILIACALFSAFARRQRVMFVVPDDIQARIVAKKITARLAKLMLDGFVFCDLLDRVKVINWLSGGAVAMDGETPSEPIPNILVASPMSIESGFFFNDVANDRVSLERLRDVITMFDVVLVDDLMEMDETVRAHFTFVLHKLRLLLSQKRIIPQIVVVTPRLLVPEGVNEISAKLFGLTQFNLENAITLNPRKCEDAWKIVLRTPPKLPPNELCQALVRKCLERSLDVVLYRKGILPYQAEELRSTIKGEMENAKLSVVARLDEIDGKMRPDAVFYLAAISGGDGLSLRLNMGGAQSVFIGISSLETADLECSRIIPILPDETAVALRIYHLKSILRFITPGMPMDEALWKHFGVSLSERNLAVVRREKDAVPAESWTQDQWDEPERYGAPLWPYVVMDERGTSSAAGFKIDFSTLPVTTENVFHVNGTNKIILGKLVETGNEVSGSLLPSMAKWVEGRRYIAGCDLAHVNRLIFGKTSEGDITGGDAKNVYTVKQFRDATEGYCMELEPRRWEGDGSDYDIPVRTFSWNVESVSIPEVTVNQGDLSFLAFSMPECRGIQRRVRATIRRLANTYGDENNVTPPRSYEYPAYMSALVFLPNRLDPNDTLAQIQLCVAGGWNTTDNKTFSIVLTHVFAGVMRRIVPDLPFFAMCPAFYTGGRDGSIGAVTFWILQPVNSGRAVNDVLVKFFGRVAKQKVVRLLEGKSELEKSVDAEFIVRQMLDAVQLVAHREKAAAILRWLRSFSGSAFDFDLTDPEADMRMKEDVGRAERILIELLERMSGSGKQDVEPVRPVPRDVSWIMRDKSFDPTVAVDVDWRDDARLPSACPVGKGEVRCSWNYAHQDFTLRFGFEEPGGAKSYLRFLDGYSRSRITGSSLSEYGCNDPYRIFVAGLCDALLKEYKRRFKDLGEAAIAEFLLSFAQSAMEYIRDPEDRETDWPRYPSETCALQGGDCEDTSILYMELLRVAGIRNALLLVPEHAAVGVAVGLQKTTMGKRPVSYRWHGTDYVYAETACSRGSTRSLGEETTLIPSAESIPAEVVPTPDNAAVGPVSACVLNAKWMIGNRMQISVVCPQGSVPGNNLSVVCYLRSSKEVFSAPQPGLNECVAVARLPTLSPLDVKTGVVQLKCPNFSDSRFVDIFICATETGAVVGHYVGAMSISPKT